MHVYKLRILLYHCASTIYLADSGFLQELAHVSTGCKWKMCITTEQLHEHHLPNMTNLISLFLLLNAMNLI